MLNVDDVEGNLDSVENGLSVKMIIDREINHA